MDHRHLQVLLLVDVLSETRERERDCLAQYMQKQRAWWIGAATTTTAIYVPAQCVSRIIRMTTTADSAIHLLLSLKNAL